MTIREIINKLASEGHSVRYRVRSDGGVIITHLNGIKYIGASGNTVARAMVGATLSEARRVQLESIKPKKGQSPQSRKLLQPDEDIKKQLRRVQRIWKKNVNPSQGKITLKKLRWKILHEGIEKAKEALSQSLRYALGLAYDENINALLDYIQNTSNMLGNPQSLEYLIEYIKENRSSIKEGSIKAIYDELYNLNDGVSAEDVADNIMTIINS